MPGVQACAHWRMPCTELRTQSMRDPLGINVLHEWLDSIDCKAATGRSHGGAIAADAAHAEGCVPALTCQVHAAAGVCIQQHQWQL